MFNDRSLPHLERSKPAGKILWTFLGSLLGPPLVTVHALRSAGLVLRQQLCEGLGVAHCEAAAQALDLSRQLLEVLVQIAGG